ncbi:MAG: hotdog fold thioesterase [Deltaproteobacteria bacterium]|nr:hotdog fold thioesterase [Deltaproteobacteria bacterium]
MTKNNDRSVFAEGYPPPHHMLRDLDVSLELRDRGPSSITIPVVPEICTDRGGVQAGILATLIDILGGALSIRAVDPDWAATADLTVYTTGQATSGRVSVAGSLLRAGNTMLVVELNILNETGFSPGKWASIGGGWISFARLPRRDDTIRIDFRSDSADRYRFAVEGSGLKRPYLEAIGAHILDEARGVVELPMSDYLRNSFGALQGGILAVLADASGQCAARTATGRSMVTRDLGIHYLSQGKTGPFRTQATVIRVTEETVLSRVEVIDTGAANRVVALATNTAIHGS